MKVLACVALPHQDAEAVGVHALRDALALEHFRRHVGRCPRLIVPRADVRPAQFGKALGLRAQVTGRLHVM